MKFISATLNSVRGAVHSSRLGGEHFGFWKNLRRRLAFLRMGSAILNSDLIQALRWLGKTKKGKSSNDTEKGVHK